MEKNQSKDFYSNEPEIKNVEHQKQEVHTKSKSPFAVLETNDGFQVILGNQIISTKMETQEEAWQYVEKPTWETIFATIHTMIEYHRGNNSKNNDNE